MTYAGPTGAHTIHEAAASTGWSPRMLRYVEQLGLVAAPRSAGGYRLYGPTELQRLCALRDLIERHNVDLGDIGFAARLRRDLALGAALDSWFETEPSAIPAGRIDVERPDVSDRSDRLQADSNWLSYEQAKHEQLLRPVHADNASSTSDRQGTP